MGFFNSEYPLGLPKGSVRAIIVIVLLSVVAIAIHRPLEVPSQAWDLLKTAFTFYFLERAIAAANGRS